MKTTIIKPKALKATWYIVDAEGKTIGHTAANIANVLRGKHKPTFAPHQLCPDQVVVINVEKLAVTPEKARRKWYFDHTGFLGHWTKTGLDKMMERHPERVLEMAIKGMLPKNRLRFRMLEHLHIHKGPDHKYGAQKPVLLTFTV